MTKTGGILAIIGGVLGFFAAMVTLFFGGVAANYSSEGDTILTAGFSGLLGSILIIVFAAIGLSPKTHYPATLTFLATCFTLWSGGGFVIFAVALSFVGAVLMLIGAIGLKKKQVEHG